MTVDARKRNNTEKRYEYHRKPGVTREESEDDAEVGSELRLGRLVSLGLERKRV